MTEAEWLACEAPQPMLKFVAPRASDRKLRLFQVACCRRAWKLMPVDEWRDAVLVAERYADKAANDRERIAAYKQLQNLPTSGLVAINAVCSVMEANKKTMQRRSFTLYGAAATFAYAERRANPKRDGYRTAYKRTHKAESQLVREVFGNPFRPVAFEPAWRTTDVALLARGIYDEKAFDRLPILADALQDAGCEVAAILDHFRDRKQKHVRGCWALDLVLGRE